MLGMLHSSKRLAGGGGTIRVYREKLEGFRKFYQIVKTVKTVTLAKFRLAGARVPTRDQTLLIARKAFDQDVSEDMEKARASPDFKQSYICLSTNRGSCGSLNNIQYRFLQGEVEEKPQAKVLCVGKKADQSLSRLIPDNYNIAVINDMKQPMSFAYGSFLFETAQAMGQYDQLDILYNRFHSASAQRLAVFSLPSFDNWWGRVTSTVAETDDGGINNYAFFNGLMECSEEDGRDFYDFYATLACTNAAAENELSEYAARIVAVENQLQNLESLAEEYNHKYNKLRKESITAELLEIIGTMVAMEGGNKKTLAKSRFWEKA